MSKISQSKINVEDLVQVRVTKLSDDVFHKVGMTHPNGIDKGYVSTGVEIAPPTLGDRYRIYSLTNRFGDFSTSPVVEIIDKNTIKTTYSTYKIEYL